MSDSAASSSDDDTDDELPTSSVAELTVAPNLDNGVNLSEVDGAGNRFGEDHERRSSTHSRLRAYEAKRRAAYESKLQSSALYWHAFRTLMHDSLLETQKAEILVRGWNHASSAYAESMKSVGGWCIDEKGFPITDAKKKKKYLEANEKQGGTVGSASGTGAAAAGSDSAIALKLSSSVPTSDKRGSSALTDFYREENCGLLIKRLADSARDVSEKYEEMAKYMNDEVLPDLSRLLSETTQEVIFMEKLGDSIINELEAAEDEVCKAWDLYYHKAIDFFSSSSEAIEVRHVGAHEGSTPDISKAVEGCADVWVEEMRYRMAVAFLSSVWEKCSSELSKLFLSTKDAECNRRSSIKELLIKATQRQERLWIGLPSAVNPILQELIDWPMERKLVEDDVQLSIRERAQAIQLEEAEHRKPDDDTKSRTAPGLTDVVEGDGNFELSSPLVSDLMCKAKTIEKRGAGMMSSWKVSLAVITSDSFLHLFELPSNCKLHSGSAPEVAFQNLIPPVVVPSMEGVKGGAKFPSAKYWFDNLVPSESFALPNCVVALTDEKIPNSFEIVETTFASGASKMFTKTVNRKMQFRTVTREEAKDFVDALKRSK